MSEEKNIEAVGVTTQTFGLELNNRAVKRYSINDIEKNESFIAFLLKYPVVAGVVKKSHINFTGDKIPVEYIFEENSLIPIICGNYLLMSTYFSFFLKKGEMVIVTTIMPYHMIYQDTAWDVVSFNTINANNNVKRYFYFYHRQFDEAVVKYKDFGTHVEVVYQQH